MNRRRWFICACAFGFASSCFVAERGAPARNHGPLPPAPAVATPMPATDAVPTDVEFWRRSRNATAVNAGRTAFNASSCRTCHGIALTGGNGPNLTDRQWLHGGTPREVYRTITRGVPSKGMPTWGPVLGPQTIADLVTFIFSHHQPGEPIEVQASFTPFTPVYE